MILRQECTAVSAISIFHKFWEDKVTIRQCPWTTPWERRAEADPNRSQSTSVQFSSVPWPIGWWSGLTSVSHLWFWVFLSFRGTLKTHLFTNQWLHRHPSISPSFSLFMFSVVYHLTQPWYNPLRFTGFTASTNQLTNQPTNQLTNQPTNQPTN